MIYSMLNSALSGALIGWLASVAGWSALSWQFWVILVGWAAVSSALRQLEKT